MRAEARPPVVLVMAPHADLERRVRERRPHSVPEVLALPVETGASDYLRWVHDSVAVEGR